ncbi:MAG: hypothetical protein AAF337_08615 [Pseudomonadota bacterium]
MRLLTLLVALGALCAPSAYAQNLSINYDRLSSLEEPLAQDVGNVTLTATGLLDAAFNNNLSSGVEDRSDVAFVGNVEVAASTQLPNRWNVQLRYFAQYQSDMTNVLVAGNMPTTDDYIDNVAGIISGAWGSFIGGNTTNLVREDTRRLRGVGNGTLAFDNNLGQMGNWGGGYVGQFGPARLSFVVDVEGDFDVGASWSRPLGTRDWRFTLRYSSGDFAPADGSQSLSSDGVVGVAEFIYGSGLYDFGVGYESLGNDAIDVERWYMSAGARYKYGAWTASIEGHYGEAAGDSEVSAALGVQFDVARGLSLNLGINHADAQIDEQGVILISQDLTQALLSARYSF